MSFKLKRKPVKVTTLDQEDGTGPVRDPKDFMIHVPGLEPLPVIGPTSGADYKRLREQEQEFIAKRAELLAILRKAWKCSQCGKTWRCRFDAAGMPIPGQLVVRPTAIQAAINPTLATPDQRFPAQIDLSRLRCADPRCDGPVVEHREILH